MTEPNQGQEENMNETKVMKWNRNLNDWVQAGTLLTPEKCQGCPCYITAEVGPTCLGRDENLRLGGGDINNPERVAPETCEVLKHRERLAQSMRKG